MPTRSPLARLALVLALVLGATALLGCGEQTRSDDAVEAQERNVVELGGLRYRVVLFRQLNPSLAPDRSLYEGPPVPEGRALYAAFLRVCNEGDRAARPTSGVQLENALGGQAFAPLAARVPEPLRYRPVELAPGECLPARDSSAEQTFDGAALLFEVPVEALQERPLILELAGPEAAEPARIELDL